MNNYSKVVFCAGCISPEEEAYTIVYTFVQPTSVRERFFVLNPHLRDPAIVEALCYFAARAALDSGDGMTYNMVHNWNDWKLMNGSV